MRLLVVGPDMRDLRKVKNFTGVQAYYLAHELRKRGVDLCFIEHKRPDPLIYFASVDTTGCDHVLALGLRYFTHQPKGCAAILKKKVPGAVTMLHDGVVHNWWQPYMHDVDCTFTFRDDSARMRDWGDRFARKNHYIGWAADPDLLYPAQVSGELRLLVDHCYYKSGQPDRTEQITRDAVAFAGSDLWRERYAVVRVRRLINGGAEDVRQHDQMAKAFDREHIPFPNIAEEYRKASVYLVTHKESVGLTALEAAYCGALVVVPKGMLYQDRLLTIRALEYEGGVPWPDVLGSINTDEAAMFARRQSWARVVDRMLTWFGSYR